MKKQVFCLLFIFLTCSLSATTVYTRVNARPSEGWAGTYLIVYEKSSTEAYVWNGEDASNNFVAINLANGKITSDNLEDYQVTVSQESTNRYYVKAQAGYIGCDAKKNGLTFSNGGKECTLQSNGGYTILETNTNTCRFLCYESSSNFRFRFYYDSDKKWDDSNKHNICFYVLGDVEQGEAANQLDLSYAHAEMYACESKFPANGDLNNQYFLTYLWLAEEEDYNAVPQVWLEILAPTQYSIAGTYKSDYTSGVKYFINCQAQSKHSYFIFPSSAEQGWSQASINLAEMTITKVGASSYSNAYTYHIKLVFTDSNKKIWTLDKDMDVFGWWIDCDRSGAEDTDMEPVAFTLESGNHTTSLEEAASPSARSCAKIIRDGQIFILRGDKLFTVTGMEVE